MPEPSDCDAVIVGTGPAGATAADVLTERGLVGRHAGEGPQPSPCSRRAVRRARTRLERRDQVATPVLPRPRPVPRTAQLPARRTRRRASLRGRGQQPAVDGRRWRLPRRRKVAALSCRRLQGALRARPDRRRRHRRLARRLRRDGAVLRRGRAPHRGRGRGRREPVRGMAQRAVSDARGRRHVRRGADHRGRGPASVTTRTARRQA